jgi:hypothetical protein
MIAVALQRSAESRSKDDGRSCREGENPERGGEEEDERIMQRWVIPFYREGVAIVRPDGIKVSRNQ